MNDREILSSYCRQYLGWLTRPNALGRSNRQGDHAVGLRERAGWQIVVHKPGALGAGHSRLNLIRGVAPQSAFREILYDPPTDLRPAWASKGCLDAAGALYAAWYIEPAAAYPLSLGL